MKMKLNWLSVILVAFVGSAVFAADPTDRLRHYQENIRTKDTGVYEHDGYLFAHVRLPLKGSASLMRVRMKAIGEVDDLLRRWGVEYAVSNKVNTGTLGYGLSVAVKVLNTVNSQWRYMDWRCRAAGQEFTGNKDGQFWLCHVIAKDAIIKRIPEGFYMDIPSTNLVLKAISTLVPAMVKTDCGRFYSDVGAVDLYDFKITDEAVLSERERAEDLFESYRTSESYLCMKRQKQRCEMANETADWEEVVGAPVVQRHESTTVVTNVISSGEIRTNRLCRAEGKEECSSFGISANKMMYEEIKVSDESEIVETKTISIVTTKRKNRRRVMRSIRGNPQFERVFLSGGVETNALMTQTTTGVAAANLYFSADATLEEREKAVHDALCETPGDVQLWNMYGRCLLKRGDHVGALICFRAAARLDRNDQFVLANLAEAYERIGCRRIACGYAILGLGMSKHEWCLRKCKDILLAK